MKIKPEWWRMVSDYYEMSFWSRDSSKKSMFVPQNLNLDFQVRKYEYINSNLNI